MFKYRLERVQAPLWKRALVPLVAIIVTFLLTSVLVLLAKANPLEAYYYFLIDPLSNKTSLIEVLVAGAVNGLSFAAMWCISMYQMWLYKLPEHLAMRHHLNHDPDD